ncbi:MAG: tetratricopeptide repeat protein, partial [Gemmataceae bacterium]
ENDSARWRDWDNLTTPDQLKAFAENKDIQEYLQGRLAGIQEARRALRDGLRKLGNPSARKEAVEDLNKAADLYDRLVNECADKPLLHQQVLSGAAKAQESLGNIEQARAYYQQLRDKYGDSFFGADAAEQLQRLDEAVANSDELQWLKNALAPPPSAPSPNLPLPGK